MYVFICETFSARQQTSGNFLMILQTIRMKGLAKKNFCLTLQQKSLSSRLPKLVNYFGLICGGATTYNARVLECFGSCDDLAGSSKGKTAGARDFPISGAPILPNRDTDLNQTSVPQLMRTLHAAPHLQPYTTPSWAKP